MTDLLLDLQQIVHKGDALSLEGGFCNCYKVNHSGDTFFYKEYFQSKLISSLKFVDIFVSRPFHLSLPHKKQRNLIQSNLFDLEKEIVAKWKSKGISVADFVGSSKNSIAYVFNPGESVYSYLSSKSDEQVFIKLLDVYQSIRTVAKENNDSTMLHPDPHLNNFLYDSVLNKVIPIDPGSSFSESTFEEIDARTNLFFLYSLNMLSVSSFEKNSIFSKAIRSFSKQDVEYMRYLNESNPLLSKAYFSFREEFVSKVYRREKRPLDQLLNGYDFNSRRMLNNLMDSYLKQ